MWPLKHFRRGDSIRISADFLETVRNMLSDVTIQPSADDTAWVQAPAPDGRGWTFFVPFGSGATSPNYRKSFDIVVKSWTSGNKPIMTVKEGYGNLQGQAPILFSETDLELEKSTALTYIFLEYPEGGSAIITKQEGGARPQTVPGTWRKVLYEVSTASNGLPTVDWDRRVDFDIGSPI